MKEQLLDFLKPISQRWKQRKIKNHPDLIEYLNFLYFDVPLDEQIYLFENNIETRPFCHCGKELYFRTDKGYSETCSKKCMGLARQTSPEWKKVQTKIKQTMMERYGAENTFAREEIKRKIKDTNLKRYGVEHPAQNLEIQEKIKQTNLARYGTIEGTINSTENLKRYRSDSFKRLENLTNSITILEKTPQDDIHLSVYEASHPNLKFLCNICDNISITNYMTYLNRCSSFGTPCPHCSKVTDRGSSFGERELVEFIKTLESNIIERDRILIAPKELDIVLPDKKMAIEYNGIYYHSDKFQDQNDHLNKLNLTNSVGYRLITIFEDEWIFKKDIIKSRLTHILGHSTNTLYARNCSVKILELNEARDFINAHHIQGYGNCRYRYGLIHHGQLVGIMTFSLPSLSKGMKNPASDLIELNRFCTSISIVGAAGKLFAKFCEDHPEYKTIYSFADRRWSNGNLYSKLGFKLNYETKPNYWYVRGHERIHRFSLRKNTKDDQSLTEAENRAKQGYYRVWDCGSLKFTYTTHI